MDLDGIHLIRFVFFSGLGGMKPLIVSLSSVTIKHWNGMFIHSKYWKDNFVPFCFSHH